MSLKVLLCSRDDASPQYWSILRAIHPRIPLQIISACPGGCRPWSEDDNKGRKASYGGCAGEPFLLASDVVGHCCDSHHCWPVTSDYVYQAMWGPNMVSFRVQKFWLQCQTSTMIECNKPLVQENVGKSIHFTWFQEEARTEVCKRSMHNAEETSIHPMSRWETCNQQMAGETCWKWSAIKFITCRSFVTTERWQKKKVRSNE